MDALKQLAKTYYYCKHLCSVLALEKLGDYYGMTTQAVLVLLPVLLGTYLCYPLNYHL